MNPDQIRILYRMMEGQAIQQFHLEHLLGAGGFGGVFQAAEVARDRVTRKVAVKLVSNTSDEQLEELNAAVNLKHKHFIDGITVGDCKLLNMDWLFLVMELADRSLDQHLGQQVMPRSEALKLIEDVATALQFLHSQRKVHCDLKPGNILFAQGCWKLSDFGLIRDLGADSYALTANPIGTIAFMPPEAFGDDDRKKRISTAWDMWSLGIMTAAVMTGKFPYNYKDQTQLLKQVINAQVQIPQLPEPFNAIVRGCLNTNFRNRWTAEQVLAALGPTPPPPSDLVEFVRVPGGVLTMKGGHKVTLKGFHISKYPITQRQYQAVMGQNPSHFKGNLECPVECVGWQDAIVFCQKLSKILKQTIDLPSETQWEWAARGATKSKGFQFAGSNNLDEVGWYDQNSGGKTHPVGQKKPNELGLYDMSGNVWEWCKDNWTANPSELPQDVTHLIKGGNSDRRALRGGSWINNSSHCSSASRLYNSPDSRNLDFGFRVVLF